MKNRVKKTILLIRIICIILLIGSLVYICKYILDVRANKKLQTELANNVEVYEEPSLKDVEIYSEEKVGEGVIVDFEKLKSINPDTVAYLRVKGTKIEYAIVRANNNSYYMTKNFERKYNIAGWPFMDYRNILDGKDKNIIIYGHNMKDESMFGTLKNILEKKWYDNEENHIIDFVTEKETSKYQVFSVYKIKVEDYYIQTSFGDNEFYEFVKTLKSRSFKNFNIDVTSEDDILTLSTCGESNNYRIVLHAKKIN